MQISHIVVILQLTPLYCYPQVNVAIIFQFGTGWITHYEHINKDNTLSIYEDKAKGINKH